MKQLNSDICNLIDSGEIMLILLSSDLTIRRFTPGLATLFEISPAHVGRPISDVPARFASRHLLADIRRVLRTRDVAEREICPVDGDRTYLMRIRPFGTTEDVIGGIAISFRDVTSRKAAAANAVLRAQNQQMALHAGQHTRELQRARASLNRELEERQAVERRLRFAAEHDRLTGLVNGDTLKDRLGRAVQEVRWWGRGIAVLSIDLDHFKPVIDMLGRPVAEEVLRITAARLRACLRTPDLAARIDGDGFVVMQANVDRRGDAQALARRLMDALDQSMRIGAHHIRLGVSVGIAVSGQGADPADLLRFSGLALMRAKRAGGSTCRVFEPEMDSQLRAEHAIEADLQTALRDDGFEVMYQPQVRLASGSLTGFEALVRLRPQAGELVMPDHFIPVAEKTGQIVPIGGFVLRRACADAQAWPRHLAVAVNVSPVQLRERHLVAYVEQVLSETGLEAERLELEVTETMLLQDNESTLGKLYALRALGVRIAMDDFGTGYSSLGFLRSFPFDRIKIDKSFTASVGQGHSGSDSMARVILGLGRGLGMKVTAEGVETKQQMDRLRQLGCGEGQGFLFGRPAAQACVLSAGFA